MTPGQLRLYSGDYNYMQQAWQPDGSIVIRLSGGKSGRTHLFHVRNLWKEDEEVLFEDEIVSQPPAWMRKRLKEARKMT